MKKIPILLSSLTLASTASTLINVIPVKANDVTGEILSSEGESAAVKHLPDLIYQESNIFDDRVKISAVLSNSELDFKFSGFADHWVSKIIVVQHKYEEGILEKEADERMTTLGEDDFTDWARGLSIRSNDLDVDRPYHLDSHFVELDGKISNPLKEGKPNIFYYAVQIRDQSIDEEGNKNWDGEYWIRGKIDLRSCVRSSANYSTQFICVPDSEENGKKYSFVLKNPKTGTFIDMPQENFVSWDEEWQQILSIQTQQLYNNINNLHYHVLSWSSAINQYEPEITKLMDLFTILNPKDPYGGYSGKISDLKQAQKRIKEIRDYYQNLTSSEDNTEELERLRTENASLKAKNDELKTELTKKTDESNTLANDLSEIKMEHVATKQAFSAMEQELQDLRQKLADLEGADNSNVDKPSADQNVGKLQKKIEDLEQELEQEQAKYQAEVEKVEMLEKEKEELSKKCSKPLDNEVPENDSNDDLSDTRQDLAQTVNENAAQSNVEASNSSVQNEESESLVFVKDALGEAKNSSSELNIDKNDIELPSLGTVETKSWLWWLILPLMAIIMTGLGVKHLMMKKR